MSVGFFAKMGDALKTVGKYGAQIAKGAARVAAPIADALGNAQLGTVSNIARGAAPLIHGIAGGGRPAPQTPQGDEFAWLRPFTSTF